MSQRNQALFWIAVISGMFALLWLLSSILLPFVAGMAVAYLLDPMADRLERSGMSRTLATSVILGVFFGLLTLLTVLLYPILVGQAISLITNLPALLDQAREAVMPLVRKVMTDLPNADEASLKQLLGGSGEKLVQWLGTLFSGLLGGGLAVVNFISLMVITPVVAFYLLRDWDKMIARIDSWLPRQYAEVIRAQASEIDRTLAGFVRGQFSVCLVMGIYYGLALTLVGLDFGLVIGLISGAISFIPYVGALLGFGVSIVVAVIQFWPDMVWIAAVAVVFGIGQFAEGNFISPKLVGDKVGLHPVWLMFALLAFGAVFGFVGVLIAVPVAAVIGVLTRFSIGRYLQSRMYLGGGAAAANPPAGEGN